MSQLPPGQKPALMKQGETSQSTEEQLALEAIEESRAYLGKLEIIVVETTKAMEKLRKQMEEAMEYLEDHEGFQKTRDNKAQREPK